ncbi:hypothetical protein M231_02980 [Tremella mesenterica]|uniref:ChrR-like cupin domain-containing protein n=1 Tax=Tremella mesenterica TaxID=5217 RepID=A0A4V1M4B5_TREME|nr:hypothetical protein M231_02980 [Tremella mesenterica]
MVKLELEFFDTYKVEEKSVGPNETERVLSRYWELCEGELSSSRSVIEVFVPTDKKILFFGPGYTQSDEPRTHVYWEEVYILEGRLYDRTLERWISPGGFCCRPPGMVHGPYTADPEVGCKQLVTLTYDKPTF